MELLFESLLGVGFVELFGDLVLSWGKSVGVDESLKVLQHV